MNVFSNKLRIRDCDVAFNRRLRPSCLFSLLQEAAIDHGELLGVGRAKTLDRGLLWVITNQRVLIHRMPEYDESLILESWPGKKLHVLFPRYYRLLDTDGNALVEASTVWTLMDAKTRSLINPDKEGICVPGIVTGHELPLPFGIRSMETSVSKSFTVPYSYTDINGHMNNIRYLDEAENMIPEIAGSKELCEICIEYSHEILQGQTITFSMGQDGSSFFFSGADDRRQYFKIRLLYR